MATCAKCRTRGLMLKLNSDGICLSCLDTELKETKRLLEQRNKQLESSKDDYAKLQASITPEMHDLVALHASIVTESDKLTAVGRQIESAQKTKSELDEELKELRKQILVTKDVLELESFSMYIPKYGFTQSADYKAQLDAIREKQSTMIRRKTAATAGTEWEVNGSKSEGKKMTDDMIKLYLRSFNNECDMAVSSVRFSNIDKCELRISKSYDTLAKLSRVTNVSISRAYMSLKIQELHLAYEYAKKKEEEKEEQRALRAEQREQAKVEAELAEARKAALKEKQHLQQAIEKLDIQIQSAPDDKKADLESKRSKLLDGVEEVDLKLEDIDYRQTNQRAGFVYIISNIGSFGENIYKIGMTRRLDPNERVDELGDASVPFRFDIHAMIFSTDAPALEAALHRAFEHKRLNKINRRREYFNVTLDEIKAVVKQNHDKTAEFIDVPKADQYRESLKMTHT